MEHQKKSLQKFIDSLNGRKFIVIDFLFLDYIHWGGHRKVILHDK